ncbi:60S ribosomal protein L11-like [Acomys russatus]|uniref:60S ribosomal protein L11-like n=1 Tax=Acomys russatus TaxID=60746 RepID=UPI0021E27F3C|nr:60S ribosomal protein L11-like [Acomys russatus]
MAAITGAEARAAETTSHSQWMQTKIVSKEGGSRAQELPLGPPRAQDQGAKKNPMWELSIHKLCLSICVGESRDTLKGQPNCQSSSQTTSVFSKARYTVRSFAIRRNEKVAFHYTVSRTKAEVILEKDLKVQGYEIWENNFSDTVNFTFGIQDHIGLHIKYNQSIVIYVLLGRPGFSLTEENLRTGCTEAKHRISGEEARRWFQWKYNGVILPGKQILSKRPNKEFSEMQRETVALRVLPSGCWRQLQRFLKVESQKLQTPLTPQGSVPFAFGT